MANIIFWRHAEAEENSLSGRDTDRVLTERGRKDAKKMAKWLYAHLPEHTRVLCSPAQRCLETVTALKKLSSIEVEVADFLSIDSTVAKMSKQLIDDDITKTLLVIGHQPSLGWMIANMLGMSDGAAVVKKGSVWWVKQRQLGGALQSYLFTAQHPDFL